jgi:CubicO group peptidase (beta-lactamase class C family)
MTARRHQWASLFMLALLVFDHLGQAAPAGLRLLPVGQASTPPTSASDANAGGPIDPQELEAFLDRLVPALLSQHQIPGARLAVVTEDTLLVAKGYGYADLTTGRRFAADQTLLRIGSTGKLVTWTAVMQLVEQGRLDLDTNVNAYLEGFQIPATFPQPVTLRHLLSHTAGFEERTLGSLARSAADLLTLREYVQAYRPERVRPPGEVTA